MTEKIYCRQFEEDQAHEGCVLCQEKAAPGSLPKLGRLAAIDVRDRRPKYAMSSPKTDRTFRNHLSPGAMWNQGSTSQCVSYGANRWLVSHRIVNKIPMSLTQFYNECQKVDEWPGEDYDGTSVRAAFKVLKRLGFVEIYSWATEVEQITRHVLEIGPVVMGTDWLDGMFRPDAKGYIWPTGRLVGGHAWMISCVNMKRKNPDGTIGAVRLFNSWGASWGQQGKAWVTLGTLARLLAGEFSGWPGEAGTADEIRVR